MPVMVCIRCLSKSIPRGLDLQVGSVLLLASLCAGVEGFTSSIALRAGMRAGLMPALKSTSSARCPGVSRLRVATPFCVSTRHTSRVGLGLSSDASQGGERGATLNATVTLTPDGWKTKKHMNAYRKIFHAVNGVLLACLYEIFMTRKQAMVVFGASFVVLTLIEILRLRYAQSAVSMFLFGKFRAIARDYETNQLSGMVYYMAGITLSVAAFPKSIAVLSVLYLALGDPFASTVGIKFGKLGPRFANGKSLIGTLGGFFICAATTALYFVRSLQLSGALALVSLLGGVAAAIPETLCGRITDGKGGPIDVDDNLAVPIGSGLLLLILLPAFFPHLV